MAAGCVDGISARWINTLLPYLKGSKRGSDEPWQRNDFVRLIPSTMGQLTAIKERQNPICQLFIFVF